MRYVLPRVEDLPLWPTIAAPVFFALFIGLVFWVYRGQRRSLYDAAALLPLENEQESES